jgi:hypothetical protein
MIPARPFVIALLLSASAGGANAADDPDRGLVACIEKARQADAACAKLTDAPAQRLECFQKARSEQLGCLEHALSDAPTGATAPVGPPEPSGQTSPGEQPSKTVTSEPPSQANPQENKPAESTQANPPANPPANNSQMSTQEAAPKTTQDNAAANAPEPRPDTATTSPPVTPPPATVEAIPSPQPPAAQTAEHPPAAARAEMHKETNKEAIKEAPKLAPKPSEAQARPPESKWVVSETTSPIDYRPLLTAVIQPSSSAPGSPNRLAVRCRGTQTELLIHSDGTWQTQRRNALPVERQVNDQAVTHEKWTLSADAKTAMYAEDTIGLLRSLPDGARLTVNVPDGANARHEATFHLAGWDAIRNKIATACKWPKPTDQASGQR